MASNQKAKTLFLQDLLLAIEQQRVMCVINGPSFDLIDSFQCRNSSLTETAEWQSQSGKHFLISNCKPPYLTPKVNVGHWDYTIDPIWVHLYMGDFNSVAWVFNLEGLKKDLRKLKGLEEQML
jgi:hypothetical protein